MLSRLAILLVAALPMLAQSTGTATVVGTVSDSTGAVVPGVRVTVRNTGTQFASEGQTNANGAYYIPNLSSGTYEIVAEAQGFKKFVQSGLTLRINESPRIDVVLEVGNVSDSVKVDAAAPLLETEHFRVLRNLGGGALMALLQRARLVLVNGGDTLVQAIVLGKACVAVPIAGDQPARIARCAGLGAALAPAVNEVEATCAALLADEARIAALEAAVATLGWHDAMPHVLGLLEDYLGYAWVRAMRSAS